MRKAIILLVIFGLSGSLWAADPIIGTWKLNAEKSKFMEWEPGPKEGHLVYREVGSDKIEVTQTSIEEDGTSSFEKCIFPAQGGVWKCEDPPQEGLSMYQIFAGPGEWYGIYIKDGKQIAIRHKVVSKDGKTMNETMKSPDYKGKPFEVFMIYDKQ